MECGVVELTYLGLIRPDENGNGFVLLFPDVDRCVCEGNSVSEVMKKAPPVLAEGLLFLELQGESRPTPRTFDEIAEDKCWKKVVKRGKLAVVAVTLQADVTLH